MFSGVIKKKIARFMAIVMLATNVSPVFAMRAAVANPEYRIRVTQQEVVQQLMAPVFMVEAQRLTQQLVSGVMTFVYQTICTQMIMMATAATLFGALQKKAEEDAQNVQPMDVEEAPAIIDEDHAKEVLEAEEPVVVPPTFVDIEGFGRVRVDETGAVILDAAALLDPTKKVAITTDRSVIIDSLKCSDLAISAPSVTVNGNSEVKSIDISVDDAFSISEGSTLAVESMEIDGKFFNHGTLNFCTPESSLISNDSELLNYGIIGGGAVSLQNLGSFLNYGTLLGQHIELQTNLLTNAGFIGTAASQLDFLVHKSFINERDIVGKSGKIVLTSEDQVFQNSGLLNIKDANVQIAGVFDNQGRGIFDKFTGSANMFLNASEFVSQSGEFSVQSGENRHILRLGTVTSAGDFLNNFTDKDSIMQVDSLLGAGKFLNKSAFAAVGTGVVGISEFRNVNMDFVRQHGAASFGNTVRFLKTLGIFVNEGTLVADSLLFDDTSTKITNTQNAVMRTSQKITGKINSFDNYGTVLSEKSFISLIFDTLANRNSFAAHGGVKLQGRHVANASRLSMSKSKIGTLVNNSGANLWMYFSSEIDRMENSGHLEYIKGEHTMDTYVGGSNSEILLPKLGEVTLPQYLVGDRNTSTEYAGTKVTWKKTLGSGKMKAGEIKTGDLDEFKNFSLQGDKIEATVSRLPQTLPTFSGDLSILANFYGFTNYNDVDLRGAHLIFDMLGGDFTNYGSIKCRDFLVKNCNIFRNRSRIETYGDINVTANQIFNACDPRIEYRSTTSQPINDLKTTYDNADASTRRSIADGYVRPNRQTNYFNFKMLGSGMMRSHAGSIILNGSSLVNNEYAFLAAALTFSLTSSYGSIINRSGNIYAMGGNPSHIQSYSFEHDCGSVESISTGTCALRWSSGGHYVGSERIVPMSSFFNTSDKAKIYSRGDLHVSTRQAPVVRGSDITSGGNIYIDAPGGRFTVQTSCNFTPQIAANGSIIVNGQDIGIQGALFLAGYGITLMASGHVVVTNPSGHQSVVPPKGAIDIPLREIAQRMYSPLLTRPLLAPDLGIEAAHHLIMDPTSGMKRLFMGQAPNPLKKLVFDINLMSVIPMVLTDMIKIFGTQALNPHRILALMDQNAKSLTSTQLVPTNIPNKPLMYFEIKDRDDDTEIAEPYLHITADMMRHALTTKIGIICENGPVVIHGHDVYLDHAIVSGTDVEITAIKDNTLQQPSRIAVKASHISAQDTLKLGAPDGVHTEAAFKVKEHETFGHNEYTRIQTAEILPTTLTGQQVILEGGSSQLRGTIVKATDFIDTTEHLLIGANKQRLEYESWKKKSHGMMGSSSIHHTGWHEIIAPSILQVENFLSMNGQSLEFESVIAQHLRQLIVQKPTFRETVATVHSHDHVETSSSGMSWGRSSISDPLVNAWQNLIHSQNAKALIGSAISSTSAIIGTVEDAKNLLAGFAGTDFSLIARTLLKRCVNVGFSIGSTKTTTTTHQTQQVPNHISAELIHLDCPTMVQLQGHHEAKDFIVNTETFETKDMVSTRKIESQTESTSFSFNLMSAVASAFLLPATSAGNLGVFAGASSASVGNVSQKSSQLTRDPCAVVADRFILRAGSAHLTDTQIRAGFLDAIIRDDIILESLCNEFFDESRGGSFNMGFGFLGLAHGIHQLAAGGAYQQLSGDNIPIGEQSSVYQALSSTGGSVIDVKEIDKRISAFTKLVGEERFNLVVGGKLIQKQQQEEHSKQDNSFTVPLGDLLTVASRLSIKEEVAKKVFQAEKAEGKSDADALKAAKETCEEVKEFTEKPEVKADYQKLEQAHLKQREAQKTMERLETEDPELKAKTIGVDVDSIAQLSVKTQDSSVLQDMERVFAWSRARQEFESQSDQIMETMVSINERLDTFSKDHPKMAKVAGIFVETIGAAAMAGALYVSAEAGLTAMLTTGTSMAAYGEMFNYFVENGAEKFVEYAASRGRTESEAVKYGMAAAGTVEKMLMVAMVRGGIKAVRGKSGGAKTVSAAEAMTIAKGIFRQKTANSNEMNAHIAEGMSSVIMQNPKMVFGREYLATIKESEMVLKAASLPGEWSGQFKLIKDIPTTTTGTEFASKVYSREVLFKDPKTGQMFRAFQRNDIDPNYVGKLDKAGTPLRNLELMQKGQAPYTSSGEQVIIHHLGQSAYGPFVEVTPTTHKPFLHNQFGYGQPHPSAPVIRPEFKSIREAYWRAYAESFK